VICVTAQFVVTCHWVVADDAVDMFNVELLIGTLEVYLFTMPSYYRTRPFAFEYNAKLCYETRTL
jgi:hypothetical protein